MTVYPIQANFTRGELHPLLHDRIDIEHFRSGLAELTNFQVLRFGGFRKRSGTKFVRRVLDESKAARLIPFTFSAEQQYVLEFGENYVQVFANGGVVTTTNTRVTSGADTRVDAAADTRVTVTPVSLVTTYTEDETPEIQFTQSADVLYLAHGAHPPAKIERTSDTAWTISDIEFTEGPFLEENESTTTLDPSGTSGSVTVTASATTGINTDTGFQATDVGRLIKYHDGTNYFWMVITAVADTTHCTATIKWRLATKATTTMGGHAATIKWSLGAWSATTGYPARVCFYEERLAWARTDLQPQTLWYSEAGSFESFMVSDTVLETDAITLTLLTGLVNEIQWIVEGPHETLVGTSGATRTVGVQDTASAFAPANVHQRKQTTYGTRPVQPVQVGDVTLYVGLYGDSLREMIYTFEKDGYTAPDVSVLSRHLLQGNDGTRAHATQQLPLANVNTVAFAQDPDSIVWLAIGNGDLVGMTYDRDQQVAGMFKHHIGGDGVVESVITIDGTTHDEVWLIVKRTIKGATARYVEILQPMFEFQDIEDAFFVDSGLVYDGAATGTVTGLDHLEGELVDILADGAVYPQQRVVNASVTLPRSATAATWSVGLPYTATAKTLPVPDVGNKDGAALGRLKRVSRVQVSVFETAGLRVGTVDRQEVVKFRSAADRMDAPVPLATARLPVYYDNRHDADGVVYLVSDVPLPATVRSLMLGVEGEP